MSKKRKKNKGNPAKQAVVKYEIDSRVKRRCAYCGDHTFVEPAQISSEQARLPHHPLPNQEWVPMCEEGRRMRGILHRQSLEA